LNTRLLELLDNGTRSMIIDGLPSAPTLDELTGQVGAALCREGGLPPECLPCGVVCRFPRGRVFPPRCQCVPVRECCSVLNIGPGKGISRARRRGPARPFPHGRSDFSCAGRACEDGPPRVPGLPPGVSRNDGTRNSMTLTLIRISIANFLLQPVGRDLCAPIEASRPIPTSSCSPTGEHVLS